MAKTKKEIDALDSNKIAPEHLLHDVYMFATQRETAKLFLQVAEAMKKQDTRNALKLYDLEKRIEKLEGRGNK